MSKYEFIIEIIRSAIVIILIFDVALANRAYRKIKSKENDLREENKNLKTKIEDLSGKVLFLEKQFLGANTQTYESIKNDDKLNENEKHAALHKLYMDNYSDANR
jgi:predicted RNase H-like nuclease (RuvC/YqgF family)